MKKILILVSFALCVFALTAAEPQFLGRFELDTYYHSNILKYSDSDLDLFESNVKPEKFELNSTDDQVIGLGGSIGVKHDFIFKHTQYDRIVFQSDNFLNNSKKSTHYIGAEIKQYFSKSLDMTFGYRFYPQIFVARYISVAEENGGYRDYDYSKNLYSASADYSLNKHVTLNYSLDYSENYYNKYFTEYDCHNISNVFGLNFAVLENLDLGVKYGLEFSDAAGKDAYDYLSNGSFQAKDASYEENEYSFSAVYQLAVADKKIRLAGSYKLQDRFFQSNEVGDIYHLGRDDRTGTLNLSCTYPLLKELKIRGFYTYENRITSSDYSEVEDGKSYDFYNLGIGLSINL